MVNRYLNRDSAENPLERERLQLDVRRDSSCNTTKHRLSAWWFAEEFFHGTVSFGSLHGPVYFGSPRSRGPADVGARRLCPPDTRWLAVGPDCVVVAGLCPAAEPAGGLVRAAPGTPLRRYA